MEDSALHLIIDQIVLRASWALPVSLHCNNMAHTSLGQCKTAVCSHGLKFYSTSHSWNGGTREIFLTTSKVLSEEWALPGELTVAFCSFNWSISKKNKTHIYYPSSRVRTTSSDPTYYNFTCLSSGACWTRGNLKGNDQEALAKHCILHSYLSFK